MSSMSSRTRRKGSFKASTSTHAEAAINPLPIANCNPPTLPSARARARARSGTRWAISQVSRLRPRVFFRDRHYELIVLEGKSDWGAGGFGSSSWLWFWFGSGTFMARFLNPFLAVVYNLGLGVSGSMQVEVSKAHHSGLMFFPYIRVIRNIKIELNGGDDSEWAREPLSIGRKEGRKDKPAWSRSARNDQRQNTTRVSKTGAEMSRLLTGVGQHSQGRNMGRNMGSMGAVATGPTGPYDGANRGRHVLSSVRWPTMNSVYFKASYSPQNV
ncbi:hypothetical protein BDP27DRAFT_1365718 [Rhodocollybia butyracea]|uniref:Uncharacterized protein n=1 Tax=Rhodocollybia butyracea TaxID=206335 RepID=A0A9P5U5Z9_9AGAR|nr:hypothetical protein BDP27DRAFT_1365718 [Rhodocollybia butyracea]